MKTLADVEPTLRNEIIGAFLTKEQLVDAIRDYTAENDTGVDLAAALERAIGEFQLACSVANIPEPGSEELWNEIFGEPELQEPEYRVRIPMGE